MRHLAALLLLVAACTPESEGSGPAIQLKRGVNTTLWLDWRSLDDMLADPSFPAAFPDVRRDVTPEMYGSLATQGFDFVRMPIDPGPLLAAGPGPVQDQLIEGMRIAITTALDAGLKVVVDLHPVPRGSDIGGVESIIGDHWPDYVTLVGRIATSLNDLPADQVALEILNEPPFDCDGVFAGAPQKWPAMQAEAHSAARAAAPGMTIVLTGACWGQAGALAVLDPSLIQDDNVLWSFHSYEPFLFSHQGAVWSGAPEKYLWDLPYPPSLLTVATADEIKAAAVARMAAEEGQADTDLIAQSVDGYRETPDDLVTRDIATAADWADSHGIPRDRLFMGEFGAIHRVDDRAMPLDGFHAFLKDKRAAAEDAGMSWAVYNHAGWMGVAIEDDPVRRLAPKTCAALGLPCAE